MDPSGPSQRAGRGVAYACAAYLLWGFYPLYFKLVQQVPSGQILAHRVLWTLPLALAIVGLQGDWRWLRQLRRRPVLLAWIFHESPSMSGLASMVARTASRMSV